MRRGDTWDLHSSAWRRERRGYSDIWVGEVVLLLLLLLLLVLLLVLLLFAGTNGTLIRLAAR